MKKLLINLLNLLYKRGEVPLPLGGYHIAWIIATLSIAAMLIILFSDASEKATRIIIASAWALMLVMELLKQVAGNVYVIDEKIVFHYRWDFMPYQFCSTPLYVLPLAAFMREGQKRDTAILFLSTFSVIGGVVVFSIPDSVLSDHIFINFQSMLHHGIQIFIGLYLASRYRRLLTKEQFSYTAFAFLFMSYLAINLNMLFCEASMSTVVNFFFINPHNRYIPPLLENLGLEKVPYIIFLVGYLGLFILGAFLLMKAEKFITEKINYDKIKIIKNI